VSCRLLSLFAVLIVTQKHARPRVVLRSEISRPFFEVIAERLPLLLAVACKVFRNVQHGDMKHVMYVKQPACWTAAFQSLDNGLHVMFVANDLLQLLSTQEFTLVRTL